MPKPHRNGLSTACAARWSKDWRGGVLLALICLLAYLPGVFQLPPIDRDEARFAEASRYMLASGNFAVPYVDQEPRLNKPPLIYWLQSGAVWLTQHLLGLPAELTGTPTNGIWAYRLPSVLGALGAVLLTWRLGLRMFAPPVGWWAAALLATSLVIAVDVRQARVDQVLLCCTLLAQLGLWRVWNSARTQHRTDWIGVALLWSGMALGVLTKGPVTPAVVGLTAIALALATRQFRWLLRLHIELGVALGVLVVTPWLILVAREVGGDVLVENLRHELWTRSTTALEGHRGFPGYHTLLVFVLFWPGIFAILPAGTLAWQRGLRRLPRRFRSAELFCVAWIVPGWVLFEIVSTKLPHYTLPMYPALALLCARALFARRRAWQALWSGGGINAVWGFVLLTEVLTVGAIVTLAFLGRLESSWSAIALTATGALLCQLLIVRLALAVKANNPVRIQTQTLGVALVAYATLFAVVLPRLQTLWISSRVVDRVQAIERSSERPLGAVGYEEASLLFLTDGQVELLRYPEVPQWLAAHPDGVLIAQPAPWLTTRGTVLLDEVRGFNYASGEHTTLQLLTPTEE